MVATLRCASSLLNESPCIISYSDIVYHPSHVRALAAAEGDIAITYDVLWETLWSARFEDPLADAETFRHSNGWLITIGNRAVKPSDIQGQYMGLVKFTPAGWQKTEAFLSTLSLAESKRLDTTSLLRGLLDNGVKIYCIPVNGRWCEVDSESDVRLYEGLLSRSQSKGAVWDHDWQW
jgi:choline kinase